MARKPKVIFKGRSKKSLAKEANRKKLPPHGPASRQKKILKKHKPGKKAK